MKAGGAGQRREPKATGNTTKKIQKPYQGGRGRAGQPLRTRTLSAHGSYHTSSSHLAQTPHPCPHQASLPTPPMDEQGPSRWESGRDSEELAERYTASDQQRGAVSQEGRVPR